MYAQAEKPKGNKGRAVANAVHQKKSIGVQKSGFVDNRPEAVGPRKIYEKAKNYSVSQFTSTDNINDAVEGENLETVQAKTSDEAVIQRVIGVNSRVEVIDTSSPKFGLKGFVIKDLGEGHWKVSWNPEHGARYDERQLREVNPNGVNCKISFKGWITGGRVVPAEKFGETGIKDGNISKAAGDSIPADISRDPGDGEWTISAIYWIVSQWGVKDNLGPVNQINIVDENSDAITNVNYMNVAMDLTPNPSDYGGRPPRNNFWSKSICEKHEKYHAQDYLWGAEAALAPNIRQIFDNKTPNNELAVRKLIDNLWFSLQHDVNIYMNDSSETRAYTDGKDDYAALAGAIRKKGDAGEYH